MILSTQDIFFLNTSIEENVRVKAPISESLISKILRTGLGFGLDENLKNPVSLCTNVHKKHNGGPIRESILRIAVRFIVTTKIFYKEYRMFQILP